MSYICCPMAIGAAVKAAAAAANTATRTIVLLRPGSGGGMMRGRMGQLRIGPVR